MTTAIGFQIRAGGSSVSLIDLFYPVGSIYQSTVSANPSTFMGGVWRQLQNRFLLGAGSKVAGETGGEEDHVLTNAEMPVHDHDMKRGSALVFIGGDGKWLPDFQATGTASGTNATGVGSVGVNGGGLLTTICRRTKLFTCGSALHRRGDRLCGLVSRAEARSKRTARSQSTAYSCHGATITQVRIGRERLGRR